MLRRASNQRAALQLLEAESRARILPEEGLGRERALGSDRGQKAKGDGHLGTQMPGGPTRGLLGKGGSNGQVGSKYAAVEAK